VEDGDKAVGGEAGASSEEEEMILSACGSGALLLPRKYDGREIWAGRLDVSFGGVSGV
jgi:hypothetical protein